MVNPTSASVPGSACARTILAATPRRWPWLKPLFADPGCDRTNLTDKAAFLGLVIEMAGHSDGEAGLGAMIEVAIGAVSPTRFAHR